VIEPQTSCAETCVSTHPTAADSQEENNNNNNSDIENYECLITRSHAYANTAYGMCRSVADDGDGVAHGVLVERGTTRSRFSPSRTTVGLTRATRTGRMRSWYPTSASLSSVSDNGALLGARHFPAAAAAAAVAERLFH